MTEFAIRPYHPSDLYALYRICLETGQDGEDATGTIDDEILGHFFAAPYAVLEPALCFVLTADGDPCGYILGTADSRRFETVARADWFEHLSHRYPFPDEKDQSREAHMIRAIHKGYVAPPWSDEYPAHLHIDILPKGQGAGYGGQMIDTFLVRLRALRCPGVHLGVSKRNERAVAFYPKFGFEVLNESATSINYGLLLRPST